MNKTPTLLLKLVILSAIFVCIHGNVILPPKKCYFSQGIERFMGSISNTFSDLVNFFSKKPLTSMNPTIIHVQDGPSGQVVVPGASCCPPAVCCATCYCKAG
ncbi:uncharacterized protein LOC126892934 [Diabrotica virgifera virgifera]|uniref:Uncharacterized protein n=1 Tax=Diabrotica virgifera virgifera TaxID=50390 RepID=A0ABM5L8R0_DIAVI|nr:uncharacterized protein LOC126892934 [Diabrotica virgifera virgifera]